MIEYARLGAGPLPIGSNCAPLEPNGEHVNMSALSAFWMLIPYCLVGIGEVFVNPVLQHYAYADTAPSMRSMMQAFNMFAMGGMPNALSSSLTSATAPFVQNNLDDGNLPVAYFINVGLGLLGCILFFVVTRGAEKDVPDAERASKTPSPHAGDSSATPAQSTIPVMLGRLHPDSSNKEEIV